MKKNELYEQMLKDADPKVRAEVRKNMEGLMVSTEQELTCIGDYLEGKFESIVESYEKGFAQGQEVGGREMLNEACEVIDQLCEGIAPHRRNFTIDDFRKAMGLNSECCEK